MVNLVHLCDVRWNPTYDSILLMYQKLIDIPDYTNQLERFTASEGPGP
jgi:hypothetical protein